MKTKIVTLGEAIRAVRLALDATQESMARRIGAQLRSYARWEAGASCPRGDWLLKIIMLCPDADARSLFGLEAASGQPRGSRPQPASDLDRTLTLAGQQNDLRALRHAMFGRPRAKPPFQSALFVGRKGDYCRVFAHRSSLAYDAYYRN